MSCFLIFFYAKKKTALPELVCTGLCGLLLWTYLSLTNFSLFDFFLFNGLYIEDMKGGARTPNNTHKCFHVAKKFFEIFGTLRRAKMSENNFDSHLAGSFATFHCKKITGQWKPFGPLIITFFTPCGSIFPPFVHLEVLLQMNISRLLEHVQGHTRFPCTLLHHVTGHAGLNAQ